MLLYLHFSFINLGYNFVNVIGSGGVKAGSQNNADYRPHDATCSNIGVFVALFKKIPFLHMVLTNEA